MLILSVLYMYNIIVKAMITILSLCGMQRGNMLLIMLYHKGMQPLAEEYPYGAQTMPFVDSCLATKVFISNLPAMGRGWVDHHKVGQSGMMNRGQLP